MKNVWLIWTPFLVSVALVLAAMVWTSGVVLKLQRSERQARQQAALEENVRLALWRMDSTLAPIVAQESVRPLGDPSLMPPFRSRWVLLEFQYGQDGRMGSLPLGQARYARTADDAERARLQQVRKGLAGLESLTTQADLLKMLPVRPVAVNQAAPLEPDGTRRSRALEEYSRRNQALVQNREVMAQNQILNLAPTAPPAALAGAVMEPLWIGDQLVLARRVVAGGRETVQGCLLDWPAIRQSLLDEVKDLLPEADLEPAAVGQRAAQSRMLAALPVRLIPGEPLGTDHEGSGPATLSLAAAWAAIGLAAAAVAVLLAGIVRLSSRRAAFVSAVTHELRTPLTTFQLYSEMLAEGMVPEPERQTYLRTLRREAQRLTHLVENVLVYARLQRGRAGGSMETLTAEELLGPMRERLADVAARAGMELVVETDPEALEAVVRANRSSVEQILLNLVDNASKYASDALDRRIHLSAAVTGQCLELRVADHGPGVSSPALRRLFRPFARSAQDAAGSAPGVGLGLALSRRLAHDMKSRLQLDRQYQGGACFVLTLEKVVPSMGHSA